MPDHVACNIRVPKATAVGGLSLGVSMLVGVSLLFWGGRMFVALDQSDAYAGLSEPARIQIRLAVGVAVASGVAAAILADRNSLKELVRLFAYASPFLIFLSPYFIDDGIGHGLFSIGCFCGEESAPTIRDVAARKINAALICYGGAACLRAYVRRRKSKTAAAHA